MAMYDDNLALNNDYTAETYSPPIVPLIVPVVEGGVAAPVVTINGNSGSGAAGPTVTFSGGSTGYGFTATASTITLTVVDAAAARAAISAAKSGVNTDITELNGATQVDVTTRYEVGGTKVVGAQGAAVADAAGGAVIDVEARAAINALLAELRAATGHGLIA